MAQLTETEQEFYRKQGAYVTERCDNQACRKPILQSYSYTVPQRKGKVLVFDTKECRAAATGIAVPKLKKKYRDRAEMPNIPTHTPRHQNIRSTSEIEKLVVELLTKKPKVKWYIRLVARALPKAKPQSVFAALHSMLKRGVVFKDGRNLTLKAGKSNPKKGRWSDDAE